jgi:restriction endonuclease Mrr
MDWPDELPDHGKVGKALKGLLVARGNKPLSAKEAYDLLADHFKLTRQQLGLVRKTAKGSESAWHNCCRTARNHLVKSGVINQKPRDTWALTDRAYAGANKSLEELDL